MDQSNIEPKGLNTSPKAQHMNFQIFGVADLKLVKSRLFCTIYVESLTVVADLSL